MVLRAFCRADVNSDFSANVDESIPYDLSSDLSSESFMDEMFGRLDMVALPLLAETVAVSCEHSTAQDDRCAQK